MKKLVKLTAIMLVALMAMPNVATAQTEPAGIDARQAIKDRFHSQESDMIHGSFYKSTDKHSELILATEQGDRAKIDEILADGEMDLNFAAYDEKGAPWSPLLVAIKHNHLDLVRYFVEEYEGKKADVNILWGYHHESSIGGTIFVSPSM